MQIYRATVINGSIAIRVYGHPQKNSTSQLNVLNKKLQRVMTRKQRDEQQPLK
jgi:hypothetical protein